jgi:hypothetical protein
LHSISPAPVAIPTHILWLFDHSSHPALTFFNIPCPKEWTFEEGEQVVVNSSNKKATIAAVKDTNLEVDLDTEEGIIIASWHNVSKVFAIGDFVAVIVVYPRKQWDGFRASKKILPISLSTTRQHLQQQYKGKFHHNTS